MEEPLEIRLAWPGRASHRVQVTMRTPGHDFELAVGMLFGEGVLVPGQIHTVAYCTDVDLSPAQLYNVVTVTLAGPPDRPPAPRADTLTAQSSACGVCGTESIEGVLRRPRSVGPGDSAGAPAGSAGAPGPAPVSAGTLHGLPAALRERQRVFGSTGGLHAAGLFDADGTLRVLREDIGRHNAVDKVIGARLLAKETTASPILCVSGRVGFDVAQKAVAAGVGLLAALGAPSSLSQGLAVDAGMGLVGFLSADRFVVYAGSARIDL